MKSSSLSTINSKILEIDIKIESANKVIKDNELSLSFENHHYDELSVRLSSLDKKMIEIKDRINKSKQQEDSLRKGSDRSHTIDKQIKNYSDAIKLAEQQIKDINSLNYNHFEEKQNDYTQNNYQSAPVNNEATPYDFGNSQTTNVVDDPFKDFGDEIKIGDNELPF